MLGWNRRFVRLESLCIWAGIVASFSGKLLSWRMGMLVSLGWNHYVGLETSELAGRESAVLFGREAGKLLSWAGIFASLDEKLLC